MQHARRKTIEPGWLARDATPIHSGVPPNGRAGPIGAADAARRIGTGGANDHVNGHPIWSNGLAADRQGVGVKRSPSPQTLAGLARNFVARQYRVLGVFLGQVARVALTVHRSNWTHGILAGGCIAALVLVFARYLLP